MNSKTGAWLLVLGALSLILWVSVAGAHVGHPKASDGKTTSVETPTADRHDHGTLESTHQEPGTQPLLSWLGRWHPLVVHFPIALLLSAVIAELLFAVTNEDSYRQALRFCLWGGTLAAVAATPLGWAFAASGATEAGRILEAHRWAGTGATALAITILWIHERAGRAAGSRRVLRVALGVQALAIAGAGFLGGSLLYGIDHLAWRP